MKPLPQEERIEKIFRLALEIKPGWTAPNICEIEFSTNPNWYGAVGVITKRTKFSIHTCDMDSNRFVETVLHELTHYNGFMDHGNQFWLTLNALKEEYFRRLPEFERRP